MPNSPLLLSHLCFGARFLQPQKTYSRILAKVCAVSMAFAHYDCFCRNPPISDDPVVRISRNLALNLKFDMENF